MTKEQKIEQTNKKIVALILERAKARRHKTWAEEQAITEMMDKLEAEIKSLKAGHD